MEELNVDVFLYNCVSKYYKVKEDAKPLFNICVEGNRTKCISRVPIIELGCEEDNSYIGCIHPSNKRRLPLPRLSEIEINRYYDEEDLVLFGCEGLYCYDIFEGLEKVKDYIFNSKSMSPKYKLMSLYSLLYSKLNIQSISILKTIRDDFMVVIQLKDELDNFRTECFLLNVEYEVLSRVSMVLKDTKDYLQANVSILCDIAKDTRSSTVINFTEEERF